MLIGGRGGAQKIMSATHITSAENEFPYAKDLGPAFCWGGGGGGGGAYWAPSKSVTGVYRTLEHVPMGGGGDLFRNIILHYWSKRKETEEKFVYNIVSSKML